MVTYGKGRDRRSGRVVQRKVSTHRPAHAARARGTGVAVAIAAVVGLVALVLTAAALQDGTQPAIATNIVSVVPKVMAGLFIVIGASAAALALASAIGPRRSKND